MCLSRDTCVIICPTFVNATRSCVCVLGDVFAVFG